MSMIISDVITSIIQVIFAFILIVQAFPPKYSGARNGWSLGISFLTCAIWLSLYAFMDIPFPPNITPILVCCFLYARIYRTGTWFMHLLMPVLFTAAAGAITSGVLGTLSLFWGIDAQNFMMEMNVRVPVTGIILLLYLPFVFLFIHFARRGHHDQVLAITTYIGMMVLLILIIFVLLMLVDTQYGKMDELSHSLPVIMAIGLILLNFVTIWLFDRMSKQAAETQQLRTEAYLSQVQVRYQQEMGATYQQMRSWRHDSHNHVQAMLGLLKMEKLDELTDYMKSFAEEFAVIEQFIASGNSMVDAILSAKKGLAIHKHIAVDMQVRLPEILPFADTELCILLGNLIDNALEACETVDNTGERFIHFSIASEDAHLRISIKNSTNGTERLLRGVFLSIKSDSSLHGLGLRSIDRIVATYSGFCDRKHENKVFSTTILFPLREVQQAKGSFDATSA